MNHIQKEDPELAFMIEQEENRQKYEINMIPSENVCSNAVMQACGTVLTNKYAEGYPKKRYYQGNTHVDDVEQLAINRAKKLFGAEHVNVQPNSGSPANMAVYFALLNPGDKILGMDLSHGGHLTHGSKVNFSGKMYNFVNYGVNKETELLDMDEIRKIAEREKPRLILSGFTAYPRKIDFDEFAEIAKDVGAISMADISHIAGLIAGEAHDSPVKSHDVITTTTHKTLRGPRSAMIMCKEQYSKAIDKAVFPGLQGGPHEHIIAAKAVAFKEASTASFKEYSKQVVKNAKVLCDELNTRGIRLISGGTDTHLLLIDLRNKEVKGKEGALALEEAGIITNMNTVPFDTGTPMNPSGIRLGTPLLTSRGMKESEMIQIGTWIAQVLENPNNAQLKMDIKEEVRQLCSIFPTTPQL